MRADDDTVAAVTYAADLFRLRRDDRESTPAPKAVLDHIARTDAAIDELRACLESMPDEISVQATAILGDSYSAKVRSVLDDLTVLRNVQWAAEQRFEDRTPRKAGERPKDAEARLLSDLERILRPYVHGGAQDAALLAGELAMFIGASGLPSTGKALADKITRFRKRSVEIASE
jgi:hypothetical protein